MALEIPLYVFGIWLLFKASVLLFGMIMFRGQDSEEVRRQKRQAEYQAKYGLPNTDWTSNNRSNPSNHRQSTDDEFDDDIPF